MVLLLHFEDSFRSPRLRIDHAKRVSVRTGNPQFPRCETSPARTFKRTRDRFYGGVLLNLRADLPGVSCRIESGEDASTKINRRPKFLTVESEAADSLGQLFGKFSDEP